MQPEVVVVVGFVILGYILFMVYSQQKPKQKRKSKAEFDPRSQQPQGVPKFRSVQSATGLLKQVTDDWTEGSIEATLIATGGPKRDEFLGKVDLIDGHQSHLEYQSDRVKLKQWIFVGAHDESDLFQQEVQYILTDLQREGWLCKAVPDVKNWWFLSR